VLSELLGFNADVMCLQEVDEKMFSACLVPQLGEEGEARGGGWGEEGDWITSANLSSAAACAVARLPATPTSHDRSGPVAAPASASAPPSAQRDPLPANPLTTTTTLTHTFITAKPCLPAPGFQGVYTNKAGKAGLSVREGSATFFRTSRFTLAAQADLILKRFFPAEVGAQPHAHTQCALTLVCVWGGGSHASAALLPRAPACAWFWASAWWRAAASLCVTRDAKHMRKCACLSGLREPNMHRGFCCVEAAACTGR
jgi:hypothetical protein